MFKSKMGLLGLIIVVAIGATVGQYIFNLTHPGVYISFTKSASGPAPEINSDTWLNGGPVSKADMLGHVAIVEFWTFECINCQDALPGLKRVYNQYKDAGLIVVGVHTPELGPERVLANVKQAIVDQGIPWPVAIDNDFKNWNAYRNIFWPAFYLIDRHGNERYLLAGEGHDAELLTDVATLLKEK